MKLKKIFVLLLILALIPMMTSAQKKHLEKPENLSSSQQAILRVEEELFAAIKDHNLTMLDRILAENFVYRSPGNAEVGKADFLKIISSSPINILSLWGEELKVNVFGETATLTGLQLAKTKTTDGKEEISAVSFTDVFVKRR